jgi:hypothetical protein
MSTGFLLVCFGKVSGLVGVVSVLAAQTKWVSPLGSMLRSLEVSGLVKRRENSSDKTPEVVEAL